MVHVSSRAPSQGGAESCLLLKEVDNQCNQRQADVLARLRCVVIVEGARVRRSSLLLEYEVDSE